MWGTEYAGVVERVGREVTRFAPGDEVFGYAEGRFGAHAEYVAVSVTSLVAPVPDGVDLPTAAAATEGGHYALSGIRRAGIRPGQRVLVHGATARSGRRPCSCSSTSARTWSPPRPPRTSSWCAARRRARHRPRDAGLHPDRSSACDAVLDMVGQEHLRGLPPDPRPRAASTCRPTSGRSPRTWPSRWSPGSGGPAAPGGLPVPDGDARGARAPPLAPGERAVPAGARPHLPARGDRRRLPLRRERAQGRQRRHRRPGTA